MSEAVTNRGVPPLATHTAASSDLRARIGWICHGLRIAAVLWFGWLAVMAVVEWSDKAFVLQTYGRWFSQDFSEVSTARYAVAIAFVAVALVSAVPVLVCIWQLAGTYLAGRVFTIDASLWLRRLGVAGVAATVISIIVRVIVGSIIASQIVIIPPRGSFVLPQDLLQMIFAVFVLALAHIFKAAAEMAEDHAQIV